jgi:DNA repair protein RecN (Recombination protein N)
LVSGLEQAQACFDQGAGGEALGKPLWEAGKIVGRREATLPDLKELADEANALASRVDDLSFQVGKALSRMEVDENDLESAQDRLAGYQDFFRKLAVHDIDGLLTEQDRLLGELSFLESAAAEVNARLKLLGERVIGLRNLAAKLSKARHKAKEVVKHRIEAELHELAMPGASIDIDFTEQARILPVFDVGLFGPEAEALWAEVADTLSGLGEHGAEKAQFLLSPNPGEALLPLQKIASGGEISRVMLALKKALAAGADTCILVFDEIDTGISGRVADVVGRKMQELAGDFQVICISHLAQVAAFADTHFLVHKFGKDKRTESTISELSTKESEEEIARLLSGDELTTSSLANAKALVKKARGRAVPEKAKH